MQLISKSSTAIILSFSMKFSVVLYTMVNSTEDLLELLFFLTIRCDQLHAFVVDIVEEVMLSGNSNSACKEKVCVNNNS